MRQLSVTVSFLGLLAISLSVSAEYAVMVSGDNYCKAEIRIGPYGNGNPESLPVLFAGPSPKGQQWIGQEGQRICARRSGNGADCNSGLTNWFCISPYTDLDQGKPRPGTF